MSQPFSRIYCVPDTANRDSERLRRRVGRYVSEFQDSQPIVERIEIETGSRVPWNGTRRSLDSFFQQAEIRDVLDGITHVYLALVQQARVRERFHQEAIVFRRQAEEWRAFIQRVLAEEHTTYMIDDECNVSYAIDEAYALNRRATLNGLQNAKWEASRAEFERAFAAIDGDLQDTNGAIRAIAASVESCLKVILGNGVPRVGPTEIDKYLRPLVQEAYSNDRTAVDASHQILKSLSAWVTATHQYRHGQGADAEVRAPIELAIQQLTSGAGFIRWLIEVDANR